MPTVRVRLIGAWLTLMALTMALAFAGDVTRTSRLGPAWLAIIAAVTLAKVRLVLADYLGLRSNGSALNGLTAAIAVTLAIVTGLFVVVTP